MKIAKKPQNEAERIANLKGLGIIYSPAEERFDRITMLAQKIFDVPVCLITLLSEKCQWFKSAQGLTVSETPRQISFCSHAILKDDVFIVSDTHKNPDFADNPLVLSEPHIRFYAGQPIKYKSTNLGTLCLIDVEPRMLRMSEIEILQSLAKWVENELEVSALSESQKELISELNESRRSAMIDPLTKVWNRKGMDELFPRELERAKRNESSVALMFIDINKFKRINDKFGHVAGDKVLKEVSHRIRSSLRATDVVARYGGDEFIIFLSGCNSKTSKILATRIMSYVCEEPVVTDENEHNVSISIGVTNIYKIDDISLDNIVSEVDKLMYEAKKIGDGKIVYSKLN